MLCLSELSAEQAVDLVHLVSANGAARLGAAARRARALLRDTPPAQLDHAWFEARNAVQQAARVEREAVSSVLHFNSAARVRSAVDQAQARITRQEEGLLASQEAEARALGATQPRRADAVDRRIPVRLTRGPLDFGLPESRLPDAEAAWYDTPEFTLSGSARFELVNFIDGTRSVTQIRDAISGEFGPVATAVVARYLNDLAKVGVIGWR